MLEPMKLNRMPELLAFLSTYFPDANPESDAETTEAFIAASTPDRQRQVLDQAKALIDEAELPLDEFGSEANRWFADSEEARAWLERIVDSLDGASGDSVAGGVVVKDVNGAVLSEGDSVQVIKDLNVKGGSSDLKRGTLIKKIHLIDDPDNIECRVNGSTLVLKTCFLKKA